MQTFLPFGADFTATAQVLDTKRLGKQRVENLQLARSILIENKWGNYPLVRQWRDYPFTLLAYHEACILEWQRRGYVDNTYPQVYDIILEHADPSLLLKPQWLHDERLQFSHRYMLYTKDPCHYAQFINAPPVKCCPKCKYWWPTHVTD